MIVTNTEELNAYLPSSVYQYNDSLLTLMLKTEENVLVPILGRKLYDRVCGIYEQLLQNFGGVTASFIQGADVTSDVRMVRLCQPVVIYMTLARNTGLLNVSLNEGGGMNQLTTNGFERPDKESINRFERDAFFNGRRGIDDLLVFLEEDARSEEPLYAEDWRTSRYFYKQGDMLFTTAIEMNRYLNIDESREKYISMLSDIRYCQNAYIAPAIGEDLFTAFTDFCSGKKNPDTELTEDRRKIWWKAIGKLRMALALYVEARRPEKQRRYSENEASLAIHQAKEYISRHQDAFGDAILDSPIYTPPPQAKPETVPDNYKPYDDSDPTNAIMVLRPGFPNRH